MPRILISLTPKGKGTPPESLPTSAHRIEGCADEALPDGERQGPLALFFDSLRSRAQRRNGLIPCRPDIECGMKGRGDMIKTYYLALRGCVIERFASFEAAEEMMQRVIGWNAELRVVDFTIGECEHPIR